MSESQFQREVRDQMNPSADPLDAKDQAIASLTDRMRELEARMAKLEAALAATL